LLFGGEVYSGWFTEWGFDWGGVTNDLISKSVQAMVDYNRSFSLYMVYGGTNFGVTAGANGFNGYFEYLPHLTSYDYDAPISEQGRATPKYLSLRSILEQEKVEHLPEIPDPLPSISI
jgi:beta-galactosidase